LWGTRARANCVAWAPTIQVGQVVGEHDAYTRLADPVLHRRALSLDAEVGVLTICDEIEAHGSHEITVYFHLAEDAIVSVARANEYRIDVAGGTVALEIDGRLTVETLRGSE